MKNVRLLNAALDEHEGRVILRGVLDNDTLDALKIDTYQREESPRSSLAKIMRGFESGSPIPDVELGMRGSKKNVRDGVYTLMDDVFIIDGLQRITAAKMFIANGGTPHLGATVYFHTDHDWERERFRIVNAERTRVSSNVLLRNDGEKYAAVEMLHRLTTGVRDFVLYERVSWNQRVKRGELITAMTLAKVCLQLHAHLQEGGGSDADGLGRSLQALVGKTGQANVKANVRAFFELIDECWGLKRVVFSEKAPYLRATFLLTFARFIQNHQIFWRDDKIFVEADLRRKIASFPTFDPTVIQMSSGGSKVNSLLYSGMIEHVNKGKRTRKLRPRSSESVTEQNGGEGDNGENEQEAA